MLWEVLAAVLIIWMVQRRWLMRRQMALARILKTNLKTYPIIGHSYMLLGTNRDRMKAFQAFGRDAIEQGGISKILHCSQLFICVADPAIAEVVLSQCLEKHHIFKIFKLVVGNGSLIAPVHIWRPRRKMNAPFFKTKNLAQFCVIFAKQSIVMADLLEKEADRGTFSVWEYIAVYTMNNVYENTMGVDAEDGSKFKNAIEELWEIGSSYMCQPWLWFIKPLLPMYRTACQHRITLRDCITKILQQKRKLIEIKQTKVSGAKRRVCSYLDHQLDAPETTLKFTDEELFEESVILMAGAHDTTAITAAFVILMLSRHPDIQDKVYEELQDVFGDSKQAVVYAELSRLQYLDAVIKETLRLYPPAPVVVRQVGKDVPLPSGITIVEGCGILMNIWAVHRNPQYWGPDADQFRPERFLDNTPAHPAAFMPFSYGPRNCIGYRYALLSVKTMLCTLLRRYRVLAPPGVLQGEPLRTTFDILMRHVDNYQIRLEHRS